MRTVFPILFLIFYAGVGLAQERLVLQNTATEKRIEIEVRDRLAIQSLDWLSYHRGRVQALSDSSIVINDHEILLRNIITIQVRDGKYRFNQTLNWFLIGSGIGLLSATPLAIIYPFISSSIAPSLLVTIGGGGALMTTGLIRVINHNRRSVIYPSQGWQWRLEGGNRFYY